MSAALRLAARRMSTNSAAPQISVAKAAEEAKSHGKPSHYYLSLHHRVHTLL